MQALAKDDASASPVEVRNLHKRHGRRFLIGRRKICPIEQDRSSILSLLEQNMRGELSRNLHIKRIDGKVGSFPDWPSKDMLTSMRQKCVARPR